MNISIADKTYEFGPGHTVNRVVVDFDEVGVPCKLRLYDSKGNTLLAVAVNENKAYVWAGKREHIDGPVLMPTGVTERKRQ